MKAGNKKHKIAIIEDDAALSEMYKIKFEIEGYDVRTAYDGVQGLEVINQFNPDIVLLDLFMPVMDGAEMLEKLRLQPHGRLMKVIVLTNVDDESTTSRIARSDPLDYLVKANVTPQIISQKVRQRLLESPK